MWQGILGHDRIAERFRQAAAKGRLNGSLLFVGPAGVGKATFAYKLAHALLCQSRPEAALDPCNCCTACQLVLAGTHPDLHLVRKPPDKSFIPLEVFIGQREHRMREGLIYELGLKPFLGGRKIAIIDDADYLHAESANCLLKTLEEPPPQTLIILIGTSPARQLPTIRSRCQLVRFQPLSAQIVEEILLREGVVSDPTQARRVALVSEGSLERARQLADPQLWSFRKTLWTALSQPRIDPLGLAEQVSSQVESAGTEAAVRRQRLHVLVDMAAQYYRQVLYYHTGQSKGSAAGPAGIGISTSGLSEGSERPMLFEPPELQAIQNWSASLDIAADCLDRCLEAAVEIDRNANLALLTEAWLVDLAQLQASSVG
ncbi:MAG: DNA polymerase III subunit [Thermoguttaceae bacterium]|nr:DNA polymerase III subunit [Thermoguttaceae bacterium]MDW8037681.1 DNA polymerase III subunit [Thermoguttaceae bacterium]